MVRRMAALSVATEETQAMVAPKSCGQAQFGFFRRGETGVLGGRKRLAKKKCNSLDQRQAAECILSTTLKSKVGIPD